MKLMQWSETKALYTEMPLMISPTIQMTNLFPLLNCFRKK